MRIDAYNQISQLYQSSKPRTVKTEREERTGKSDAIEISRTGKEIQAAKQAVKGAPDIREDKVNDLKERLVSGTYNVTGADLAEKLVNSHFNGLF